MTEGSTTPWERIREIMDRHGYKNISHFARKIGLSWPESLYLIKRGMNGISPRMATLIAHTFPDADECYLRTGKFAEKVVRIPFYSSNGIDHYRAGDPPDDYLTAPFPGGPPLAFATVNNYNEPIAGIMSGAVLIFGNVHRQCFDLDKPHLILTPHRTLLRFLGDDERTGHYRAWSDNPRKRPVVIEAGEITALFSLRYILNIY